MARLDRKTAIITGAAGAFGQAMVDLFVAEGAFVVGCDLPGAPLAATRERHGDRVLTIDLDVGSESDWARALEATVARFGRLDILVNNAGISHTGAPQDPEHVKLDQWRAVHRVNVEGTLLGCQAAIGAMRDAGGVIINISSVAALNPSPKMIAYGASKAAVRHMTRSVAAYCAQENYPIRCNSIHPGWFLTPMVRGSRTEAELDAQRKAIPMRRFGEALDVARAALFLASEEARYMTGAKIVVDGGVTMEP